MEASLCVGGPWRTSSNAAEASWQTTTILQVLFISFYLNLSQTCPQIYSIDLLLHYIILYHKGPWMAAHLSSAFRLIHSPNMSSKLYQIVLLYYSLSILCNSYRSVAILSHLSTSVFKLRRAAASSSFYLVIYLFFNSTVPSKFRQKKKKTLIYILKMNKRTCCSINFIYNS